MTRRRDPSRRFLIGSAMMSAGGLAVGLPIAGAPSVAKAQAPATSPTATISAPNELTAWVVIKPDETVIVRIPRSELGQGTMTGLAQLAAEELDCEWSRVTTEMPGPGLNQARDRIWGDFVTTGSRGIRGSQEALRKSGAAARQMLIEAAALWRVPPFQLSTSKGAVIHPATRRRLSYGRLAAAASKVKIPDFRYVKLKDPKTWTIVGKPLKALDTADKLSGKAIYGIDLQLPDMLMAAIRDAPHFGEKLAAFDPAAVKDMPGVRHVLKVGDTAVCVVAESWWQAKKALDALPVTWDDRGSQPRINSAVIAEHLKEGLDARDAFVGTTHGDALKAISAATKKVEAIYTLPYLHQAPLEPINCTALWKPDRIEVWVGTQNAEGALKAAADTAGLPLSAAEIHRLPVGGAFGRRGRQDYVIQAVQIARQVPGTPIKLIWSREEDMSNGFYRPAAQAKLTGGVDEKGEVSGLIMRISCQSILAGQLAPGQKPGRDARMFQGLYADVGEAQIGYSIPNLYIDHALRQTPVPVGSWRGVHANQNALFFECFIDELATAAGKSPLEFRRAMMRSHPRHLAVLTAASEKAGWNRVDVERPHRGVAQLMSYGSYAAAVAEVSMRDGKIKVTRVVVALDCGNVVNPDLVTSQVEGQVAFALGAMLHQEITIADGRVSEHNFDTYPSLTMAEMPVVETVLVPSGEFWGGVGESVVSIIPPAVLNAVFAATGKRIRSLPLKHVKF